MGVNAYFGPRRTNRPHKTPNYVPGIYKFEVDYHRHIYCSPEKLSRIRKKLEKSGQEAMYSSKGFSSNYMELVCYETCDKLIWTYGKG